MNSADKLEEENILLFDGICNLCNAFVKFIIKRDKKNRFKFAALQSVAGQALLKKYELQTDNYTSFVLITGNHYSLRSSAGLSVLKKLGGLWKLFYIFIFIPRPLRDFIYNIIAKTRYKIFGRRDTCMIPTSDIKQKFLS